MRVTQRVGGSGLRRSKRRVDLIAKHGIFRMSCQYMHAEGKEKRLSMHRDNYVENRHSKSAVA